MGTSIYYAHILWFNEFYSNLRLTHVEIVSYVQAASEPSASFVLIRSSMQAKTLEIEITAATRLLGRRIWTFQLPRHIWQESRWSDPM